MDKINNFWFEEDVRIVLAIIIGGSIIVGLSLFNYKRMKKRKHQKQYAIDNKHIIHAKRVKTWKGRNDYDTTYHGVYEYEIDGRKKLYSIHAKTGVPMVQLSLYYVETPYDVFSDYDHLELGYTIAILLGIIGLLLTLLLTGCIHS